MRAIIKKGIAKRKKIANTKSLKRLVFMNKRLYHNLTHTQEEYLDLE